MKLTDYLNLYLGCYFQFVSKCGKETFVGVIENWTKHGFICGTDQNDEIYEIDYPECGEIYPLLHKPYYMDKSNKDLYYALCKKVIDANGVTKIVDTPESIHHLLKIHVDCFDLIKNGLAKDIDKFQTEISDYKKTHIK